MARSGNNHKGGRPKGTKSQTTIEREAVLAQFRQRAMKVADTLLNAQLALARGQMFLYCIKTVNVGKRSVREKPVLVTDEQMISAYLDGSLDQVEDEYYYITTKEPSNLAIDSILDRTFGKATQAVEISGGLKIGKLEEIQKATKEILG